MSRSTRSLITALVVNTFTAFTPSTFALAAPPSDLRLELVAEGFASPVALRHAGDGSGRLFVVERGGLVRIVTAGGVLAQPFLDVTSEIGVISGELGLVGLAFHPRFAENGYVYVSFAHGLSAFESVVRRYTVSAADPDRVDPASAVDVLVVPQDTPIHNGGDVHFGPDGDLYVALGDGSPRGDPLNRAQDLGSLLGKVLRLDVDAASPYAVPADNPFVGDGGARDEIWARGLRNPWRFSFDRRTGDLWLGDVGQDAREEIDFQPASSAGGENYGWDCREGDQPYTGANSGTICSGPLVEPVLVYPHVFDDPLCRGAVTAGFRYRGHRIAQFDGTFVYADYCQDEIWLARETSPGVFAASELEEGDDLVAAVTSFGEDEEGELYVVTLGGQVFRLVSPSSLFVDGFEAGVPEGWTVTTSP